MKILLVSFYFPPDLSAGSYRIKALLDSILAEYKDVNIEVFTTTPNRYKSYRPEIDDVYDNRVKINRFKIYNHNSGLLGQMIAFFLFSISVLKKTKYGDWDLVFATSSRLMTAYLGSIISKRKGIPLYLDIRDLFVDTINDVYSRKLVIFLSYFLKLIEKKTYLQAKKINLVSNGFNNYVQNISSKINISNFTNGIDEEFLNYDFSSGNSKNKLVRVTYAGNIGSSQGLEKIIPKVALLTLNKYVFNVIGDGSTRRILENTINEMNINNVNLYNPVSRSRLLNIYAETDILFLHLNDMKAFEKVLPSKLFEYAATNKLIIAGVSGYARKFINEYISGAYTFDPCDHKQMLKILNLFTPENNFHGERQDFCKRFSRNAIMKSMSHDIIKLIENENK